jgi:peptidoglycan-associated lipoprotein
MRVNATLCRTLILVSCCLLLLPVACKRRTQPIARGPAPPPDRTATAPADFAAPTIELSAAPTTLRRGEQANLTWRAANADRVVIDGGVGNVTMEGSVAVTPLESATYTATASGRGGEARASARITVVRDERAAEIDETDVQALRRAIEEGLVRPVFFAYDRYDLSTEARATLEENSRWFRRYPNARIVIEGHCDERGTEEYNLALGDRRAQAAREYLVQLGVEARRIETISYGEERPFVMGSNEAAWAQNRRAHFVVQ